MNLVVPQLGEGLDSVRVISRLVEKGDSLKKDQCYISVETDKSAVDIEVPANGVLTKWLCAEGDEVGIGGILAEFAPAEVKSAENKVIEKKDSLSSIDDPGKKKGFLLPPKTRRYINQLQLDTGLLEKHFKNSIKVLLPEHVDEYLNTRNQKLCISDQSSTKGAIVKVSHSSKDIFISNIVAKQGSRKVNNDDMDVINANFFQTTGIQSRNYINREEGETGVGLACSVVKDCLQENHLTIQDINFLICATGTPKQVTPSMANSILNELSNSAGQSHLCAAFDINAACSGWLYGLQLAYDFLSNSPQANVMLVTCETLSEVLDFSDSHSAPLFGDAVSATLISNANNMQRMFRLYRPSLASVADIDCSIRVPFIEPSPMDTNDYLSIHGRKVFNVAVKSMSSHLENYSRENSTPLENLDWVVSHQANDRIIHAVKNKLAVDGVNFLSHIKHTGNTSSSSIPLSIDQRLDAFNSNDLIGVVAFGGGYTLGATFLERY